MRKFSSYGPINTKLHYYVTITVVFFVEAVDDENRSLYETPYQDATTGVMVEPVLVTTVE